MPHREVPYNLAMEYARKRNFGFLEVSAKTGTGIKNAFNGLIRGKFRQSLTHTLFIITFLTNLNLIEIYRNQVIQ